jgi:hypothetical protein
MNPYKLILLILSLLFCSLLKSQDYEKMNKKELKEEIELFLSKLDSLNSEIRSINFSKDSLQKNLNYFGEKKNELEEKLSKLRKNYDESLLMNNKNEQEINVLNNKISSLKKNHESEFSSLRKKYDDEINRLSKSLKEKTDEVIALNKSFEEAENRIKLLTVFQDSSFISQDTTIDKSDFLNSYFLNQFPLNNNSYELKLAKVIYQETVSAAYNNQFEGSYYNVYRPTLQDGNYHLDQDLPELLEVNNFNFLFVKPNLSTSSNNINDYLYTKSVDYFNAKFPKIEILKNKLFTLKYQNGVEESFLFNVKELISFNNQRQILQFELANEDIDKTGNNYYNQVNNKDILWRVYSIGNESYIALNYLQIKRLGIEIGNKDVGIEVSDKTNTKQYFNLKNNYYSNNYHTTGEGIFISRKKDIFMNGSDIFFVHPSSMIFLFKLKQL